MYIKVVAVCVAVFILAGCASNTEMTQTEQGAQEFVERDDGYRCDRETITGSRFPVKRCTTAYQRKKEAAEAKEAMSRVHTSVGEQD
jgi:outer membrane murein-binding lipoprotein Lpp